MVLGYSRLIINERVLPDDNSATSIYVANMDLNILLTCGSLERTENQWRELLERGAGLKILGIWRAEEDKRDGAEIGYGGGIIECEASI
jgi:hypothetical protein